MPRRPGFLRNEAGAKPIGLAEVAQSQHATSQRPGNPGGVGIRDGRCEQPFPPVIATSPRRLARWFLADQRVDDAGGPIGPSAPGSRGVKLRPAAALLVDIDRAAGCLDFPNRAQHRLRGAAWAPHKARRTDARAAVMGRCALVPASGAWLLTSPVVPSMAATPTASASSPKMTR
jgi:hypothetical protein